jgi:hypothetical protein
MRTYHRPAAAVAVVGPTGRPSVRFELLAGIRCITRSWWRSAPVFTAALAQVDLSRWCVAVADRRRWGHSTLSELAASEPLLGLPSCPSEPSGSSRATRRAVGSIAFRALERRAGRANGDRRGGTRG